MHCCRTHDEPAATAGSSPSTGPSGTHTAARRVRDLLQWALPITALALVPKCPMCLAAYVLLFTGVGLSLDAAAAPRWAMITLSLGALAVLLLRLLRRALTPAT
jgi:hypothetical protein